METVQTLQAQNRQLREDNDELRETVRQLRESAAFEVVPLPEGISHLTRLEERALRALLARPTLADKEYVYRAMYPDRDEVDIKIVDVMIYHIRRKVPRSVLQITTLWGRGYETTVATVAPVPLQGASKKAA